MNRDMETLDGEQPQIVQPINGSSTQPRRKGPARHMLNLNAYITYFLQASEQLVGASDDFRDGGDDWDHVYMYINSGLFL